MAVKITSKGGGMNRMTEELTTFSAAVNSYRAAGNLLDPTSIEAALRQAEEHVDREAGRYPNNVLIHSTVPAMKQALRDLVAEQAQIAQGQTKA